MVKERREQTAWYIKALQNAIIPIIAVAAMAYLTLDRVEARLGNHIEKKGIHKSFEDIEVKFVPRKENNLHMIQANRRFDTQEAMLMKIIDILNERGKRK